MTVEVVDVNDPPALVDGERNIDENAADGTAAGAPIVGVDQDVDDVLSYRIEGGSGTARFDIDESTGVVTANGAALDHETMGSLTLLVRVTDTAGASDVATVTVVVDDVNEAPVMADTTRAVEEKKAVGTTVGSPLSFSDQDVSDSHTFAIKDIVPATPVGGLAPFAINPADGQIQVNDPDLNAKTLDTYTLTVTVTDDGTPVLDATATVVVSVVDKNDPPALSCASFLMAENTKRGEPAPGSSVSATDEEGHTITFSIIAGNDDQAWAIDARTAQIQVNPDAPATTWLNFETRASYPLLVQAKDDGPGEMTSTCVVTASLQNLNEAPIVSSESLTRSVEEPPRRRWRSARTSAPRSRRRTRTSARR